MVGKNDHPLFELDLSEKGQFPPRLSDLSF